MLDGMQGYFHSLAAEVYRENVRVTVALPGPVLSNALAAAFTDKVGQVRYATPHQHSAHSTHIFLEEEFPSLLCFLPFPFEVGPLPFRPSP